MHLLAAQPGGFVDDEGIIDLAQTPAPLVIMAAADSTLAALAAAVDQLPDNAPEVRLASWVQLLKPAAFDLYEHKVLEHARVVVVSLLGGENYWQYGVERLQAWAQRPGRTLILVPGDDSDDPQLREYSNVDAEDQQRSWRFLREGGLVNSRSLLQFLQQRFLDISEQSWREPEALPRALLYGSGGQIATLKQWQAHWQPGLPVVALLFYRSHLQSANTVMFDQLIERMQQAGLNPLPIAISSLKDAESIAVVNRLLVQSDARLILNSTGFACNRVGSPDLASQPTGFDSPFELKLPVLQLVLSSSTEEDWLAQQQGLRSRDVAMQVVLPEMDGRVLTRAVSFKTVETFNERAQLPVVRYQLHTERADFVCHLARRYCVLADKPNHKKRIALILANYPTRDGRIGNGVGLDTPASTVNILRALKDAGYPLGSSPEEKLPENGDALIEALLEVVTNNPDTVHHLACWQSMAVAEYLHHFAQLPEQSQRAIWQRWGAPEQDLKYRNGRLMLSGIRLGETFVGIQPARGYNLDLAACYHDPDLIPPHNYLAFYFWLRHCYQVDAVIHVGKHGNLEWLPGKGLALSEQCWPDAVLGPMPHFYPFIVNDPGEGAQAKRRTQAVIIDHLMPPMTRAESYGELAELEGLVDEFYQAMGLDSRREAWLREQILEKVRSSHLLEELPGQANAGDDTLLEELDTYLCEIKEAQIRNGLHILGQLPENARLADTLVALLRLPRGESVEARGILHNLADDLKLGSGLVSSGLVSSDVKDDFDPLDVTHQRWNGPQPQRLAAISDQLWRSEADTRERLELLAAQLIQTCLIEGHDADLDDLPATATQLRYLKTTLYCALETSAEQELSALLDGLAGRFVPPGPSGAPTRGRLDTLPTGRNFFSVDNRAIPSPAAWALGQQSAAALVLRHLQETGDYPAQLGLSVWGTATMRTGGDDIAQAFALMGVKPIWAPGSNRVTDFEIIPAMQLGRPRVDVTLRVSGFFRDAFPNVMKLYDAAVQALAALNEPGTSNRIRQHIEQRQQQLQAQGMPVEQAVRQASYRVFGSKPGAYGAGLQGLIDERCWEDKSDLADAYLNWGGYAYGNQPGDGVDAREAFAVRLGQLEAVVQNQDNREHDLLDSDDYYQFQGGMTNAVRVLSGAMPQVYHSDHANPAKPKIRTLNEELNRVVRSRVLNPKWIEAMQQHGYKGAFEMTASVDYLFAYDATTDLVADYQYQQVTDALVFDEQNRAFMQQHNQHALEEMAERLLEAIQRGLWAEPGDYGTRLQDLLLELDEGQEGVGAP
ncbi:MAG: cobaltochelatase subunit CobN [Marinobacterium sp.]|nr:cobaltochelatase subunit CobN [Marinobacterium sp.]